MMPPDIIFFVRQQRRREMLREAEQARLLRATRPTPDNGERAFQHFIWWVGGALLTWGCALQHLPEELPDDDIVSELLPSVRAMVRSLPELDRQALVLIEYQGLTQKELGERLGLSFSGAKSRVQRAREKLKQQLLECCHFELDRRGHIINYQPRCHCCETGACCADQLIKPTRGKATILSSSATK